MWWFVPRHDGYDLIVNASSGLVLGDPGFSHRSDIQIIQWQPNTGFNEQWQIDAVGNGNVIIVNVDSNGPLVLADTGGPTFNGTSLLQQQSYGTLFQQWQLVGVNPGY
jgi:hypothetical protein